MGTVFRARDRLTGKQAALKLVTTDTKRLAREVNALAELDHPSVVRYIDHKHDDTASYLAMEWLDGEDLGARLKRGPMPLRRRACAHLERIASGLAAAHARGIIHRDIKPRNIVLVNGEPDRATIVDFGIARQDNDQTFTRGIIGTPRYMAPEQVTGDRIGPRADVYSLGCVVFECIAGQAPFVASDWMGVMAAKVMADPPRLVDFVDHAPPGASTRCSACMLARDPDRARPAGRRRARRQRSPRCGSSSGEASPGDNPSTDGSVAVTRRESRIATMILARGEAGAPKEEGHATMQIVGPSELQPVIGNLAARSAHLADGTLVVAVDEPGEAGRSRRARRPCGGGAHRAVPVAARRPRDRQAVGRRRRLHRHRPRHHAAPAPARRGVARRRLRRPARAHPPHQLRGRHGEPGRRAR